MNNTSSAQCIAMLHATRRRNPNSSLSLMNALLGGPELQGTIEERTRNPPKLER